MHNCFIVNEDRFLDLEVRVYTNRSSFLRILRRASTKPNVRNVGGVCFTGTPGKDKVLPCDVWIDGSKPRTDLHTIVDHECIHVAQRMYEHMLRMRRIKKADRHDFEAYLGSGLGHIVNEWIKRDFIFPKGHSPVFNRLFAQVDYAFECTK